MVEQVIERFAHLALAHRVAGALHVGGVRHQRQHALVAQRGEASQIHQLPVDGRKVHLEVARMHDHANRRMNRQRAGSGDGMAHLEKFHAEHAQRHGVVRRDDVHFHAAQQLVLLELALDQRRGQPRGVHRGGNLAQHVGRGADVILVPVRDQIAAHAAAVHGKVGNVGNHEVDARHILAGKDGAHVDDDDVVSVFKRGHVLADFAQPAQRDDAKPVFRARALPL